MERLMVTGASGLLGLNVALQAAKSCHVVGVDKLAALKPDTFELLQADLLEPGAVPDLLHRVKPDWIIHCAALANVDTCEEQPELAFRLNASLPGEIAIQAAQRGIRMIHISTDAVFDGQKGDYIEEDTPSPLSVYARTKLEGEISVAAADPQAIIARVNFFGWSVSGDRSLAEFFFNNLRDGKPIKGFMDVYYCPLLANDLADILQAMLQHGLSGLYHVVSSEKLSKYQFGVSLANRFGFDAGLLSPISVYDFGLKAARSPLLTLNTNKLATALGAPPDIQTGLDRFYRLYQDGYPDYLKGLVSDR